MGLQSDFWAGIGVEASYGSAATPSLFWEAAPKLTEKISTANGKGYRPAQRGVRGVRNTIAKRESSGTIEQTASSRGLLRLLQAFFGASTLTTIGTTTAKQGVFTLATSDFLPSYTLQQVAPILGGTDQAYTFLGAQCTGLDISAKAGEGVDIKSTWVAKEQSIAVGRATPSFAASLEQFTFVGAGISLCGGSLLGTYTAPTTTAPASIDWGEDTPYTPAVREVSLSLSNDVDSDGFNLGGSGLRTRSVAIKGGSEKIATGSLTAEFTDTALIEAARARTDLSLLLTFAGLVDIASGIKPLLQFGMPLVRLDTDTPTGNDGNVITNKINFTAYAPASGEPIHAVYRTLDTTL